MTKSRIGKKWFYDPISLRHIKCFPENKPENFIAGRVFNKK